MFHKFLRRKERSDAIGTEWDKAWDKTDEYRWIGTSLKYKIIVPKREIAMSIANTS